MTITININQKKARGKAMKGNNLSNTLNAGIDYSLGQANVNHKTGIHYGVINQSEVLQAWADSSEAIYPPCCPYCGEQIATTMENIYEAINEKENNDDTYHCPKCNNELTQDSFELSDPSQFTYENDGYICTQDSDDPDIFVIESPYFTYCKFASPCAPGAGYLMDHTTTKAMGIKAYCFGGDWFEGNKAPYTVYNVKTGKKVNP